MDPPKFSNPMTWALSGVFALPLAVAGKKLTKGGSFPFLLSHLIKGTLEAEVLQDTKGYKLTFVNNLNVKFWDKGKKTELANGIHLPKIINYTIHQVRISRNQSNNLHLLFNSSIMRGLYVKMSSLLRCYKKKKSLQQCQVILKC